MIKDNVNEILLTSFKDTFDEISKKKYIYNSEDKTSNDSKLLLDVFNTWQKVFRKRLKVNNIISEKVFELLEDPQPNVIDIMLMNVEQLKRIDISKKLAHPWEQFLLKIIDHIKLIDTQQAQILKNTKRIEDLLSLSNSKLRQLQNQSENLMEKTEVIKKIQEKSDEDTEVIKKIQEKSDEDTEVIKKIQEKSDEDTEVIKKIQKKSDEDTEVIKKIQEKSDEDTEVIKKIQEKSESIQKEFIAILGIFASILIAAFGGLTSLASLFEKINEVATYKLVFLGSFEVLSILMILFLMLNGVAKLTGLNLRSCGCKENEKCECKIHKKHPTLFMLTILIILLAFISTAPILNGFISNWNSNNSNITTLILYSVMIVISIIIIVCSWIFIHNKKDAEEAPPNQ